MNKIKDYKAKQNDCFFKKDNNACPEHFVDIKEKALEIKNNLLLLEEMLNLDLKIIYEEKIPINLEYAEELELVK